MKNVQIKNEWHSNKKATETVAFLRVASVADANLIGIYIASTISFLFQSSRSAETLRDMPDCSGTYRIA